MRNFYEILEVDKSSTSSDIKKAYNKLLRKYPPEKEAEKYKEIREAYDTLKDEKSRKNYDIYFSYGDEIKKLEESAKNNIEDENYLQAERSLKKILIMAEDIAHIREMLGQVLLLQKKYSESLEQFKKLTEEYSENADYYIKLGNVYNEIKQYLEAERAYFKAYDIDFSIFLSINSIVYLYINLDNVDKAIKFLEKEISRDNSLDFDDFYSLTQLIECYVYKNDKNGVQKVIKDIKKIVPIDEDSKKYISWKLAKLGYQIHEIKLYSLASEVLKLSVDLDPQNPDIKEILNLSKLYSMTDDLINDDSLYAPITGPILFYMHGTKENQEQREENLEIIGKLLDGINLDVLEQMKTSLEIIKSRYNPLYLERKDIYMAVETDLNKQLLFVRELHGIISNNNISSGLKHFICALAENDDRDFENSIKKLGSEQTSYVLNSIGIVQTNYPKVYERFNPFFNNIRNVSLSSNNSSSNSSGGCYVATAVYGSYDCAAVWTLRRFRDQTLAGTWYGRSFIKIYYAISPSLVKWLGKTDWFKKMWKNPLDILVMKLQKKGIEATPYDDRKERV